MDVVTGRPYLDAPNCTFAASLVRLWEEELKQHKEMRDLFLGRAQILRDVCGQLKALHKDSENVEDALEDLEIVANDLANAAKYYAIDFEADEVDEMEKEASADCGYNFPKVSRSQIKLCEFRFPVLNTANGPDQRMISHHFARMAFATCVPSQNEDFFVSKTDCVAGSRIAIHVVTFCDARSIGLLKNSLELLQPSVHFRTRFQELGFFHKLEPSCNQFLKF